MAAVVVFVTTYMMILPAITLDVEAASTQAGMESVETAPEQEENKESFGAEQEEESEDEEESQPEEEASPEEENESEEDALTGQDTDAAGDDKAADEVAEADEDEDTGTDEDSEAPGEKANTASTEMAAPEIELITEETQLTYETDDYIVYADFGEAARLPVGVELRVREVTKGSDSEAYQAYFEAAQSWIQDKYDDASALSFAKFYDITFMYESAKIEPSGDVKVRIEYKNVINVAEGIAVDTIHFDKDDKENAVVINSKVETEPAEQRILSDSGEVLETAVKAVEFETDRFFVCGIVGIEKYSGGVLTAAGETYEITVTYTGNAQIPTDAELQVTEITITEEDYGAYLQQVANMFGIVEDSEEILSGRVFDMKLVSGGEPIIPATQIQVEIRYSEAEAQSQDSMVAVQFFDEKSSIVETEALLEENILKGFSFETDRLTTTAIVELNETNEEGVLSARYGTLRFVLKYVGDEKLPDDARLIITKKEPTDEEWDSIFRAYSSLKKGLYIQMLEDLKVLDLKIIDSNGETIISNAAEMYLTVKNAKTPGEGRDLSIIYLSDEEQVLINKELTEEKTDEPHISSPLQGICAIVDVYVTDAPDSVAEPAKGD